jgi:murein L,D-transpeptidase YcbB/YkuD
MDAPLVAALARFQARHGLQADGVLGAGTLAAVQVPVTERIQQLLMSMERARWLPRPSGPFILVNIPQFRLYAFRGPGDSEQHMLAMNVIVGRTFPSHNTPVFMADMRYVVFRPYWDVPGSIARNEILPKLRQNLAWGAEQDYELVRGQSDNSPVVAWEESALEPLQRGELRVRQKPGPRNALGRVKFMFPNPYNVYLHSTPAQSLFARTERAFSHGCMRVANWDVIRLVQKVTAGIPVVIE